MARISNVNVEAHEDSTDRLAAVSHSSYQGRTQRSNYTRNRGGYNRGGNSYRTRASNGQTCFVCNRHGHYARNCTDQFCQKCGTKGHAMRDCVEQISAITEKETSRSVPEETVVINVSIENIICDAMIDSGAALSVIDERTIHKLNLKIQPLKKDLRAFDNSIVKSPGFVELCVKIGTKSIIHKFVVITDQQGKSVLVLGRDFQKCFSQTIFDWKHQRVCLGNEWFNTTMWIRGGQLESRISVAKDFEESSGNLKFDINPKLSSEQQVELRELLKEFADRFAKDNKKPTLTNLGEHVIGVMPDAKPVKCKRYRISPYQEKEIAKQADKMVQDGIARLSNSPWAHNVVSVTKKDGTERFVVDYRELNKVTVKDSYPMPDVQEIIDKMNGSKYFQS